MKVLVDRNSGEIQGTFQEPLTFSMGGKFAIDVPSSLDVIANTSNINDLIQAKLDAYSSSHASLPYIEHDEFLDVSQIDTILSTGVIIGPSKRTCLLQGGTLYTTTFIPPVSITKVFLHYTGFSLSRDTGFSPILSTPRMVLNHYPSFIEFDSLMITASITDSIGAFSSTPVPDTEHVTSTPPSFRLSFSNNLTTPIYISDWFLLYEGTVIP